MQRLAKASVRIKVVAARYDQPYQEGSRHDQKGGRGNGT